MCGVIAVYESKLTDSELRLKTLTMQRLLRHRGPDGSGIVVSNMNVNSAIAHERLAIIDPLKGNQPLFSEDQTKALSVNGEIYNHKKLRNSLNYKFRTESDSEVIIHLYDLLGCDVVTKLDGDFAFCILNKNTGQIYAARDPIGVNPMYCGKATDGSVCFASEAKSLIYYGCFDIHVFPPGHFWTSESNTFTRYYHPKWFNSKNAIVPYEKTLLQKTLLNAVNKRLMTDVSFGVLLSGGLDSSIIASIVTRLQRRKFFVHGQKTSIEPIKTFSIGLKNSPDLLAAQKVADYLGTDHFSFTFTIQEGIDAISDIIYYLETYDITTIRAGTPMFLLARKIKSMGIKMLLSGEGADEIFGGYLYFHKAPNSSEFHDECVRKLNDLHLYDCLRANKATMAHGLEVRVPFLDREMLEVAMMINPEDKMCDKKIEKYILRNAFDDEDVPYLPKEILWRQKEQFSDGVGYSWIDGIQEYVEKIISDKCMETLSSKYPHNTPRTKEGAYYRQIFCSHFQENDKNNFEKTVRGGLSIACSSETAIDWDISWSNPLKQDQSGRMIESHVDRKYVEQFLE